MSWLNITRNIEDYGEETIGWLAVQNDLWAITTSGSAPDTVARLRKKINADGSSQAWNDTHIGLPTAASYDITGFAEDTEYNRLYIANGATGEVFYNITGDPQDDWDKLLDKTYGKFQGVEGNIKDLIFYNKKVYLAHKGGVSVMNPLTREWSVVGDFTEGFEGAGQCNGFHVLNNELYVAVAFGNLGAVFKYNADISSLEWDKVAELSALSINPEYLTTRDNILFCTDNGVGQNIFNSEGIDITLTGQPRFTRSKHLAGVPSSLHTYSVDNFIYATCWDEGFSEESDAHTDNLITSIRQLKPYSAEPGETFISAVTGETLNDYTQHTTRDGGDWFSTVRDNSDLTIKFAVQTNGLEFLPGETYTITWEYGFTCRATAISSVDGSRLSVGGSGPLQVGFKSNVGTGMDSNSPKATYVNNSGDLFDLERKAATRRHTFTFQADNVAATTDGEFRIEGTVAATVKGAQRLYETWQLFADAVIKNLKVFRGDEEIANSQFVNIEYAVKEFSSISATERENHSIGEPSPPDQWFVKFPAAGGSPVIPSIPPSLGIAPGGGGGSDWPPIVPPPDDPDDPDDPIIPPPDDPNDPGGDTITIDNNVTEGFATKLSRLLVTNKIDLQPNSIYRFHVIINRVKNSDANKVLKVRINPSLAALRPSFDGTISTSGIQFPIEWEFDTTGIAAADLREVRFRIDMFEENIDVADAAAAYVSDINILGKIRELPINTIYRYDGEIWDNAITQVSSDGGIVSGSPHSLVESYEVNSVAQRLYCISDGNIYVWGLDVNDPYGGTTASRIVVSW
ncbi:hypothetical protein LCGC14_1316740 [marine sediment metagenome]|uniref:Uncharacterized protein n=2 Tax=marine sediment metagenome TaxID=412755 RepID=A0A0F9N1I8_9ZZZZ